MSRWVGAASGVGVDHSWIAGDSGYDSEGVLYFVYALHGSIGIKLVGASGAAVVFRLLCCGV